MRWDFAGVIENLFLKVDVTILGNTTIREIICKVTSGKPGINALPVDMLRPAGNAVFG
jgi:hypothetical protein